MSLLKLHKAGRKFDAQLGKLLFHLNVEHMGDDSYYFKAPDGHCGPKCHDHQHYLPDYSTDIAAAWEVMEELIRRGWLPGVSSCGGHGWRCDMMTTAHGGKDFYVISAESAAHAICLAAHKVLEAE